MGKKKALTKNKLCKLQENTIDITENKVYNDYNNITKNIKKNIRRNSKMTKRERVIAAIEARVSDADRAAAVFRLGEMFQRRDLSFGLIDVEFSFVRNHG